MRDFIDLGCAPCRESCAQVGSEDYWERAQRECRAYIALLRRSLGNEPDGAQLRSKRNPHDFGTYLSVVCAYDAGNKAATDYAFRCEAHGPAEWDEQARAELAHSKGDSHEQLD
jgi:hypothetical protein